MIYKKYYKIIYKKYYKIIYLYYLQKKLLDYMEKLVLKMLITKMFVMKIIILRKSRKYLTVTRLPNIVAKVLENLFKKCYFYENMLFFEFYIRIIKASLICNSNLDK